MRKATPIRLPYDPKNEAEWLALRRQGIGGSDAAAAIGQSKWVTPTELIMEKRGDIEADDLSEIERVHFGNILEQIVADEYCRRTGRKVRKVNAILRHPDHPYMQASLDRDVVGEDRALECKTVDGMLYRKGDWGDEGTDNIPTEYFVQCQHNLAVCGKSIMDLPVLIGGNTLKIYTVERDEELIDMLAEREAEIWKHVLEGTMPELDFEDTRSLEDVKLMFPGTNGEEIDLSADLEKWSLISAECSKEIKLLEDAKKCALARIAKAMGESAVAKLPSGGMYTRKVVKRKGFTVEPIQYVDLRFKKG